MFRRDLGCVNPPRQRKGTKEPGRAFGGKLDRLEHSVAHHRDTRRHAIAFACIAGQAAVFATMTTGKEQHDE